MMTIAYKVIMIAALCLTIVGASVAGANNGFLPGQAVMRIGAEADPDSIVFGTDATLADSIPLDRIFLISFPPQVPVEQIILSLQNEAGVIFAEPNYEVGFPESYQMSISFPDDNPPPHISGESPASFYDQPAFYSIGADSAHLLSRGNNINVAVIDNGIDFNHPLFAGAITDFGFDFLDGDGDPSEEEGAVFGHGTFVSGLVILLAPESRITPLRAFNGEGIGDIFSVAQAIYYAAESDVDVINMSFGMYDQSYLLARACSTAVEAGLLLVAASGNDASGAPAYPAALPDVIAVSAIDDLDLSAYFSNYGPHIDVCAPGVSVYSSLPGEYQWGTWSGTSFSAPMVSAVCALVLARNDNYTSTAMEAHIRQTAGVDLLWGTVTAPDDYYGFGKINAAEAVWTVEETGGNICGDVNLDGIVDIGDVVFLVSYIFKYGEAPDPINRGDINCDMAVNVADAVYLISYIFNGGEAPCCQ